MTRSSAPTTAILVVDDDHRNLFAAKTVLEPLGHPLVLAVSGPEAIRKVESTDFVAILMDVHMPGMDGYETVAAIRKVERSADVPIIFLTAVYDQQEHMRRGYDLGAVDYVTKPFDTWVLQAKLRALISLYLRGQRLERARSEEVERVKDLFLGAVGHDLRNPLSAITLAATLLADKPCDAPSHKSHAERIGRAATRMTGIVEDVLDLTRGEFMDGIPLSRQPTDLVELGRRLIAELQAAYPRRALQLDTPTALVGDWDTARIGRVISNLLGNALQHSTDGPVRLTVREASRAAVVEVYNQGTPIPRDARIFEPFRRGDSSSGGLGLGLYIVREIVRAHGGSVSLRSSAADGTVFTLTLPLHRPYDPEAPPPAP
jgi:two-component system, sensor histidine kinase and response regulator